MTPIVSGRRVEQMGHAKPDHQEPRNGGLLPVAVPAVIAVALGVWNISRNDSMWRDESVTYQVSHRSIGQIWDLLHHVDAVHGLYYVIMHMVFATTGGGLTSLRLPSVIATAVCAGVIAATVRRVSGARAGLLAGSLYAILPITLKYAQEGRSYALVSAFAALSVYCFTRAVSSAESRLRWWAAAAICVLVATWLNEFAALLLAAQAVSLYVLNAPRLGWRRWGVWSGAVVLAVVPLGLVSRRQASTQLGWLHRPSLWNWALFALEATALAACSMAARPRSEGQLDLRRIGIPLFVAPTALLLAVSELKPFYVDRYVLYTYIGLAVVAGPAADAALHRVTRLRPPLRVLVLATITVSAVAVLAPWWVETRLPSSRKDNVVAIELAVRSVAHPGDAVVFLPSRRREWLLTFPGTLHELRDIALRASPAASATLEGTQVSPTVAARRLSDARRVVVLSDESADFPPPSSTTDRAEEEVLRAQFQRVSTDHARGGTVTLYVRRA